MKKAVVLNDTSTRYHHGCSRVMRVLEDSLRKEGIILSGSSRAHENWKHDRAFLTALDACDIIIINGEGTIHDAAPGAKRLLDIIHSPQRRGRPVVLLNSIWQNNPNDWVKLLDRCDIVAVRDSQSAKELGAAGFSRARFVPDLSVTGAAEVTHSPRNQLVVGDSVRQTARHALAKLAQAQGAVYLPTKTLKNSIWQNPLFAALLWRIYTGVFSGPVPTFRMAPDEADYLRELSAATGHFTGRFHGVCLSMVAETPFIALASTTSKIQTLLADAGLPASRLRDVQSLLNDPYQTVPAFSDLEIESIRKFRSSANASARDLFKDIRALL